MPKTQKSNFLIKLEETSYDSPAVISEPAAEQAASKIYSSIIEGKTTAIQAAELFKFVATTFEKLKDFTDENGKNKFSDLVRDEIIKNADNGKSCFSKYGTKIELAETGTKYVFEGCGDSEWNDLNKQKLEIDAKIKEREKFLKGVTKTLIITNGETGETTEINPPLKTSTSSYKQTLVKG